MKKITPYIIIFFIFVNLFAPLSLELRDNKIAINKNTANAESISIADAGNITQNLRDRTKKECLETVSSIQKDFCFNARVNSANSDATVIIYLLGKDFTGNDVYKVNLNITDNTGNTFTSTTVPTMTEQSITEDQNLPATFTGANQEIKYDGYKFQTTIADLDPAKTYNFEITIGKFLVSAWVTMGEIALGPIAGGILAVNEVGAKIQGVPSVVTIKNVAISGDAKQIMSPVESAGNINEASIMPACSMLGTGNGTFMGCVAQAIYYVLFQTTSYVFALAGTLFDNAFAFSVDDNSYRSPFVVEGWKVVRDFCNMFFIFILLYVAFGTILNLNGVKTKEMIINVVLIGIFINFSLFASQVIIDASNILARVFYNSNTITISVDDSASGSKVIPLSEALVNKINPQEIILSASKIDTTKDTRGKAGSSTSEISTSSGISTGTFILVTLLATMVNLVGIFVFFSIAFIFIARVIGLWLAMIFVPFAFLSYTVPAMQDFEMVGWKKWWPETLKMAFLAPIFIFFLYLILQFIETGFAITQTDESPAGLSLMIGIILPFAFIMILLLKAKSIATDMSGKIGETLSKAGAAVGGLALGVATGGAGLLARGTIGRLGSSIANNEKLKASEAKGNVFAKGLRSIGTSAGKGSYDVRATKLGAATGKATGMNLGEAKGKGGFDQAKVDQKAKTEKRAKELEVGENSPLKQNLNNAEAGLKTLQNNNGKELEKADIDINLKRIAQQDKTAAATADPTAENKKAAADAIKDLNAAIKAKNDINAGGEIKDENGNLTGKYNTTNGNISQTEVDGNEKTAKESEAAAATAKANKSKISTDAAKTKEDSIKKAEEIETTTNEKAVNEANNMVSQAEEKATQASAAYSSAKLAAQSDPTDQSMMDNVIKTKEASEKANKEVEETKKNADNKIVQTALDAKSAKESAIEEAERVEVETTLNADNAEIDAIKKAGEDRAKATISNARAAEARANGGMGNSIKDLMATEIPKARAELNKENNVRKVNQAKVLRGKPSKVMNFISSGGQYSAKTADQAAHSIIMNTKTESAK